MFQIACFAVPPKNPEERKVFWAYLNLTAASFKALDPEIRTVFLTAGQEKPPQGLHIDRVKKLPRKTRLNKGLMVDELQGWLDFANSDLFDRPTILVDPDLLAQRRLDDVFEEDFDVGLTWRAVDETRQFTDFAQHGNTQHINAGVVFLNPRRKDAVVRFFEACLADLLSLEAPFWQWYGDQEVLQRVSGVGADKAYHPEIRDIDGVRIRQFPCQDYNFSPPYLPSGQPCANHYPDPCIVHFKGRRKGVMFHYAQHYLGMNLQHDQKAPGRVRITLP